LGIRIFDARRDSKGRPDRREGKKVSGGHFFSPWESPSKARRIRKGCGLPLSQVERNADTHLGIRIFDARRDSKGRPDRREGKKVSGGHFFSPWESPSNARRIQDGCGLHLSYVHRMGYTLLGIPVFDCGQGLERTARTK